MLDQRPRGQTAAPAAYAGAVDHYTSAGRRDAVKRHWEEPAARAVVDAALARVPAGTDPLRVLDVGCGTGEGLTLLRSTPAWRAREADGVRLRYVGLDLDARLLAVARERHGDDASVMLVHGDVRDGVPVDDADLHVSSGVPYSHLTPDELEDALAGMLGHAARRRRPVTLVVDVLGRYSVEWTSRWAQRRWAYRMSFFRSPHAAASTDMTCYSGAELRALLDRAARRGGCALDRVECWDRSVLVGRHTTTGEYTPGLRPYRELVNALYDPDGTVDLEELAFDLDLPEAPAEITDFFADFRAAWNAAVRDAVRRGGRTGHGSPATAPPAGPRHGAVERDPTDVAARAELAERLRRLEATQQRGLGVGHSLTAVATTRP